MLTLCYLEWCASWQTELETCASGNRTYSNKDCWDLSQVESWKTSGILISWMDLTGSLGNSSWHLLLAKGLWKYVDGSVVLPEDATAEQRARHQSESQKAFSVIAMSVRTSQLYLIISCEDLEGAWNALKKHFERETRVKKLFLKQQYFRKEMREGIDMLLKEMKELAAQSVHQSLKKIKLSLFLEVCCHHSPLSSLLLRHA